MLFISGKTPDSLIRRTQRIQKIDAAAHRIINGMRAKTREAVQQAIADRQATIAAMTDEIVQLRNI
jgi:HAMP domain-containing protein